MATSFWKAWGSCESAGLRVSGMRLSVSGLENGSEVVIRCGCGGFDVAAPLEGTCATATAPHILDHQHRVQHGLAPTKGHRICLYHEATADCIAKVPFLRTRVVSTR